MENHILTTLAVNPGTRYIGVAVFSQTLLIDWGVKTLRGKWSRAKLQRALGVIKEMMERHNPTVIALKRLAAFRSSRNLETLTASIHHLAEAKGIRIFEYSLAELKRRHSGESPIRNRKQLAEILTEKYPDLHLELEKEKRNRNPYQLRMFEAVAIGALASEERA